MPTERFKPATTPSEETPGLRPSPHEPDDHHGHHGHHGAEVELRPGWNRPKPEHVPRPTYWPAVLALGVTFLVWGLITTYIISAVGLVLFVIALAGWIGEMRDGA